VATTLILFLIGLPALAIGTWAGLQLFGKLDDQAFRRLVLVLLLVSGAKPAGAREITRACGADRNSRRQI